MKIYITQHALTQGIVEAEIEKLPEDNIVRVEPSTEARAQGHLPTYFHKPHWHVTREEAVARANKMLAAKIAAVKKQLQKLEKTSF